MVVLEGPDSALRMRAAYHLAQQLGKSIYRIRLDELVSRSPGDAGKHLAAAFDGAEAAHGILLIDGADALFGPSDAASSTAHLPSRRELTGILGRLRKHSCASILTASHIRTIHPSILDAVRAILKLGGTAAS